MYEGQVSCLKSLPTKTIVRVVHLSPNSHLLHRWGHWMLLLVCQMSWENLIALLKGKIDLIYHLQMRNRHCLYGMVCTCVHLV